MRRFKRLRNRDAFCVKTPYDRLTALGALRASTAPRRGGGGGDLCFMGDLPCGDAAFTLRPLCFGRNSWLPVLRCQLTAAADGTRLHVTARCWWFTRGLMALWYAGLAAVTLGAVAELLLDGVCREMWILPVAWALGFLLPHAAFWRPMDRARADLCRVLRGNIEVESD